MLLIVLGFVLVSLDPPAVLFLLFLAYALSGYVMSAAVAGKRDHGDKRPVETSAPDCQACHRRWIELYLTHD